jgi:hypothetical protein
VGYRIYITKALLALSPLELGLLPELVVFMLAHFLFAPLFDVPHSFTSLFYMNRGHGKAEISVL